MKNFNKKLLIGSAIALLSGVAFSTSCPPIGGYRLTSHDANNTHCTYTSNNPGSISIRGTRAVHNCPRFILTDPGFRQEGTCQVVLRAGVNALNQGGGNRRAQCQCSISAH